MMLSSLDDVELVDRSKTIGTGAFSKVYKVIHRKNRRPYALKIIDMERLSLADCLSLRNEIELHEKLDHPNIIRFHDSVQIDDVVYFLLEYAGNKSLFHYIQTNRGLSENLALRFLFQSCLAVKYLHDRRIIHRDIKPENLLMTEDFNIKLCDFGWSCSADADEQTRSVVCGTFDYMAPEVALRQPQGPKTDVWALGIVLFEMLTGSPPFKANSTAQLLKQMSEKRIYFPSFISKPIQGLLTGMLEQDIEKRLDINQVITHPALSRVFSRLYGSVSQSEKAELLENHTMNNGGENLKLIQEIEAMIQKSEAEKEKIEMMNARSAPVEVLPHNVARGKKVVSLGDPLNTNIKVEQNYVFNDRPAEEKEITPQNYQEVKSQRKKWDPSVAWKQVSTLDLAFNSSAKEKETNSTQSVTNQASQRFSMTNFSLASPFSKGVNREDLYGQSRTTTPSLYQPQGALSNRVQYRVSEVQGAVGQGFDSQKGLSVSQFGNFQGGRNFQNLNKSDLGIDLRNVRTTEPLFTINEGGMRTDRAWAEPRTSRVDLNWRPDVGRV